MGVCAWGGAALRFVGTRRDGADVVDVAMVVVGVAVVVAYVELADGFSVAGSELGLADPVAVDSVPPVPVSIAVTIWFWEVSVPVPVPVSCTFTLSAFWDRGFWVCFVGKTGQLVQRTLLC